jgi:hypothetical protein
MAFRKNQTVTMGPLGIFGIVIHKMEIQKRENVRTRERAARVPRAGNAQHFNNVTADG